MKEKINQKRQDVIFDLFSSPNRTVEENIINLHIMSSRILEIGACIILLIISFMSAVLDVFNSVIIVSSIICFSIFIILNLSMDEYWSTMKTLFILWSFWMFYSILWYKSDYLDSPSLTIQILITVLIYGVILVYIIIEFITMMKNPKAFDYSHSNRIYIIFVVVLLLNVMPFENNVIFINPVFTGIKFTLMCFVFFILRHSFDPELSSQGTQDLELICRFIQIDYIIFGHLYAVAPLTLLHVMILTWMRK